ncbi:uncharacterized protein LOC106637574 isoform X2 [Copidosoma floridanum]|uniref:uncharacterized protein LOC106637574 isoform X2 n=1 Tax=Copidosoma floridanum TaxID=29053 RepID=UPI0006C9927B|nr:uncharacterized protein LOC106637574 isoform X2 [Copidosoma floridanum]
MEEKKELDIFEDISAFMERDSRGVEMLTYGIAGIGLITALYKIRPFAKFTRPSQVPRNFFKNKVLLEGKVKNIEPAPQPHLLVDHKPLVPILRLGTPKYLPVKISGVNVTGNGLSWLQAVVKGQNIKFLPVARDDKFLTCIVMVPQKDKESISVGKELLKVGFATVEKEKYIIPTDKEVKSYQKSLQLAQKWAERNRNGIWQFKYPPSVLWKIRKSLDDKLRSMLPDSLLRYFNI